MKKHGKKKHGKKNGFMKYISCSSAWLEKQILGTPNRFENNKTSIKRKSMYTMRPGRGGRDWLASIASVPKVMEKPSF